MVGHDVKNFNFSPDVEITREMIEEAVSEMGEEVLLMDGFDDAFIGLSQRMNAPLLAVYSIDKVIDILVKRDGMSYEQAVEFAEFNIIGAWVGEKTPILVMNVL